MSTLVRLIHHTPDPEQVMGYCARVSNPANQDAPAANLLQYCIKNGHWSVFEMASLCLEIKTSRGIAPQILRHRSFSFQEFSQRYASPSAFVAYLPRRQDVKNRQNSIDDLPPETMEWFVEAQVKHAQESKRLYDAAVEKGIAKECARFLLPLGVETTLYMHGTIRSWIHYLQLRTTPGTQKEHRELALKAQEIFTQVCPNVAKALYWGDDHE